MLSYQDILKRLIAFFRSKAESGTAITVRTQIDQLVRGGPAALTSILREVQGLPWVVREGMSLRPRPSGRLTVQDLALRLFASQRVAREGEGPPAKKARVATKKAKKAKKAAKKRAKKAVKKVAKKTAKKAVKKAAAKPLGAGLDLRPRLRTSQFSRIIDPLPGGDPFQLPPTPVTGEGTEADEKTRKDLTYTVFYGTNRQPNDPENIAKGFSAVRDTKIHLGVCKVYIPEAHEIGSTGSSWWNRLVTGVDDRLKLRSIEELSAEAFWQGVAAQLKTLRVDYRDAVIFVHGYRLSFEDAALRAAQLGTDLSVRGCMAFYSWPSMGSAGGYTADEATIEASESYITQFMIDFAQNSGATKIHIIAHSMGNRGVLRAVNRIASAATRQTGKPFDQIILAAPDVDADTFRELCKAYGDVSRRTTLYVSSRDRAVEAAQWLHGFARAGLLPPVMVVPGIDTVNVTNADLTVLGHGYVAQARDVLSDIHLLMRSGAPPGERFGLRQQSSEDGKTYWLIGK
jgi:esterase/lipase superfamily enzyme